MENGRIALVTGASRGIGFHLAGQLAQAGWKVIGTSRHPEALAPQDRPDGVIYEQLDLLDEASIKRLVEKIDRIDVLVNNAGASQMAPVEDVPIQKIRELFELDFFGPLLLMKGLLPRLRESKGRIINIGSYASHTPVPFSAVYASCKAALETLSFGMQGELQEFGVKLVTIAPTFVATNIHQEKICGKESAYYPFFKSVSDKRDSNIDGGAHPRDIAFQILKIIESNDPKPFYGVGRNARLYNMGERILSRARVQKGIIKRFR